jgi:hypothetical protein
LYRVMLVRFTLVTATARVALAVAHPARTALTRTPDGSGGRERGA